MPTRDRAWRRSAAALFLAAAALPATAADKPCTKEDAALADKAIDSVTSWAALQRVVRDYRHCDTGPARATFSEALLRVVIDGWPRLADAQPILDKDEAFRDWVSTRLGSPAIGAEDAQAIRDLAKANCPKGQSRTCESLLSALEAGKPLPTIQFAPPPKPAAPAADPK
jgi:hypothetical protein